MNRSIRYAAITWGSVATMHYVALPYLAGGDTIDALPLASITIQASGSAPFSTIAGRMIVNTFTDVEHETMTPAKALISVPSWPIAHATLDADIANYPSKRFTLRNGILVFRQHPPSLRPSALIAKEDTKMRTKLLVAAIIFGLPVVPGHAAQEQKQLSCTGNLIESAAAEGKPSTLKLSLGPRKNVTLDLGDGSIKARTASDNDIQLKFIAKEFVGEYFHYTGDLFLIYKSGKLMRMTCQK
jgi:hypothetical protein